MNMEKVYDYGPILIMMFGMAAGMIAPKNIAGTVTLLSLFGSVGWIGAIEIGFRLKASEFLYIRLICRPSQRELHCWIKEQKEGIRSRPVPGTDDYFITLDLAEPISYQDFEEIIQIDISHEWPWEERLLFLPGRAIYKGYPLQHNKCATIVVWEPDEDSTRLDFNNPVPYFRISDAPRDWYLLNEPPKVDRPLVIGNQANLIELETRLNKAESESRKWKMRYEEEHRLRIRVHGFVESLQNQFNAVLARTRDVKQLLKEEMINLLSAHATLNGAKDELSPKNWFQITKYAALAIIGIAGIFLFATSESLQLWVSNNWIFVLGLAGVGAAFMYFKGGGKL